MFLVTGYHGLGSLLGLVFSFIILFQLVLPMIVNGSDPLHAAILGVLFITPITFFTSHGANKKTAIAAIGTLITLVIAAVLASLFARLGHLTGAASEEAAYLTLDTASQIDFQGLILAGIIISVLGVLDDITISQASIVQELRAAKTRISFRELFTRAMRFGRDHIASIVNTLVLVYTGAALPLLILFLDRGQAFSTVISYEFVSEEIIRTLIGSSALVLAVPITTLLAVVAFKRR